MARVDGGLYGDTKLYYATDVLKSAPWGNDEEATNLLKLYRPDSPKCQPITIDKLMPNDIFSLTAEGLAGTASAGHNVGLASAGGVKLVVDAATSGMGTVIGTVLDIANAKVGIMVK